MNKNPEKDLRAAVSLVQFALIFSMSAELLSLVNTQGWKAPCRQEADLSWTGLHVTFLLVRTASPTSTV